MAESEELKSLLMKVKEESEKVALKLKIQKTKIMASPITSWQIDGETMETVTDFILGALSQLRWAGPGLTFRTHDGTGFHGSPEKHILTVVLELKGRGALQRKPALSTCSSTQEGSQKVAGWTRNSSPP